MALAISALERPANASSFLFKTIGTMDRAAGGLKQAGPRDLGVQNLGSSKPAVHDRSTRHTQPFFPGTAVSKPWRVSTRTVASADIEGGAALRANAISALRSAMRYGSTGPMVGSGVSPARAQGGLSITNATKSCSEIVRAAPLFIGPPCAGQAGKAR